MARMKTRCHTKPQRTQRIASSEYLGASWNRVVDPAVRVGLGETLWAEAGDASLPGAGTALIALRNLAEAGDEERAKVADRAFACAAAGAKGSYLCIRFC